MGDGNLDIHGVQQNMKLIEIAFRKIGEGWKRRVFKSQAALEKWLDKHGEGLAEVRVAQN